MQITAGFAILVFNMKVTALASLISGSGFVIMALSEKRRIISKGYSVYLFRVAGYTYFTRTGKHPIGMILQNNTEPFKKYHVAVKDNLTTPEVGDIIMVYVPAGAKRKEYNNQHYYTSVLGYEKIVQCNKSAPQYE